MHHRCLSTSLIISLTLKVNSNASSDAPLESSLSRADGHVKVDVGSHRGRAVEDGLLDAKSEERLRDIVGLGGAVAAGLAVDGAATRRAAVHGNAFGMSRARCGGLAVGTVDERDVVPDLAASNGVLELGLLSVDNGVSLGDLERGASLVEGFGVLSASRNASHCSFVVSANRRNPDVVGAEVGDDGVTSESQASLKGHEEGSLGEHGGRCVTSSRYVWKQLFVFFWRKSGRDLLKRISLLGSKRAQ